MIGTLLNAAHHPVKKVPATENTVADIGKLRKNGSRIADILIIFRLVNFGAYYPNNFLIRSFNSLIATKKNELSSERRKKFLFAAPYFEKRI